MHFDIAVQHIAGSNLKFTDYLSRNPVGGEPTENKYDEEYVINLSAEHSELNAKYDSLFDNQSNYSKQDTEIKRNTSESENEQKNDQSHAIRDSRTNATRTKLTNESENTTSGQSEISTAKISLNSKGEEDFEKMNRENLYHWGATREIMEIIRRRN